MRHLSVLFIHFISTLARLLGPGGVRSLVAESLLLKHQLLILNRSRKRSPNLSAQDRILAGLLALLVRPTRLLRSAIALKPSTLLGFHKALSKQKYRMLFSLNRRRKPGPTGPSPELIHAVVEMKQRNPNWAVRESHNKSPWRSTSQSTKTWFEGFSPIITCRDRTPVVLPG
jgi:putative transposase